MDILSRKMIRMAIVGSTICFSPEGRRKHQEGEIRAFLKVYHIFIADSKTLQIKQLDSRSVLAAITKLLRDNLGATANFCELSMKL